MFKKQRGKKWQLIGGPLAVGEGSSHGTTGTMVNAALPVRGKR